MTFRSKATTDSRSHEETLVDRLLAGDEAAFEEFANDYFPRLLRFALGRLGGDYDLAREIVQSTVSKAVVRLETYRGDASLSTWLCACCRNEIAQHFRAQSRTPPMVELEDTLLASEPEMENGSPKGPEADLIRHEETERVHQTIDELAPRYGKALEWKYIDGLSVKEIARRLGTGPKAAESILTRARQAFRQSYERLSRDPKLRAFPSPSPIFTKASPS